MKNKYELPPTPPIFEKNDPQIEIIPRRDSPLSKFCPFRKTIISRSGCGFSEAMAVHEDFLPCLREQCMMYTELKKMCKLFGS